MLDADCDAYVLFYAILRCVSMLLMASSRPQDNQHA